MSRPLRLLGGFGVQYWGNAYDAQSLAAAPHDLLIIEATRKLDQISRSRPEIRFSAEEIAIIRRGGARQVVGYLNVAEVEDYRDYAAAARNRGWSGAPSPAGEPLSAYWTPHWRAVLKERLDVLLALGFDGVFLDDVLHYFTWGGIAAQGGIGHLEGAPQNVHEFARAMIGLVSDLTDYARHQAPEARCDFRVVVNNGVFIGPDSAGDDGAVEAFDRYLDAIDAILIESALAREDAAAQEVLRDVYRAANIEVLAVEFASAAVPGHEAAFRARVAAEAAAQDFRLYIADDENFDRLAPPRLQAGLGVAAATP